jgi:large subunit ribosomal protein L11
LGVNIGQVIAEINKKTASFKGMQVPVKIVVDAGTKTFEILVGTPPSSSLLLKEAGIEKGSGNPKEDLVADLRIEQVIKVAKMKEGTLMGTTLKDRIKEVMGTARSMGLMVEGKPAAQALIDVNKGLFDKEIKEEKTELTQEELRELDEEKRHLAEEITRRREEFLSKAKQIISSMQGKERGEIKRKLVEAAVPNAIIDELLPAVGPTAEAGAAPGAAPAGGKAEAAKPEAKGKK